MKGFMAKPIEPTPILRGKDAERLLYEVEHPDVSEKHLAFLRECDRIYQMTNGSRKTKGRSAQKRA
jgi:hypothetical protein